MTHMKDHTHQHYFGIKFKEIKKDTFQDVFDKMEVLLKNKKLNKQDFDFFLGRDVPLKFGKNLL